MKRNRYLPFGYEVIDGSICISKNEAIIVKTIFEAYKSELIQRKLKFEEIGGLGQQRVQNAIQAVKSLFHS